MSSDSVAGSMPYHCLPLFPPLNLQADSSNMARTLSPNAADSLRVKRAPVGPTQPPSPSAGAPSVLTPAMTRTGSTDDNAENLCPDITTSTPASKTSVAQYVTGNLAFIALRLFYGTEDIMRLLQRSASSQNKTVWSGKVSTGAAFEINQGGNGLLMCPTMHKWFDNLRLWLEPVYPPNWRC